MTIILPDNPLFHITLATARRPDWKDKAAITGNGCNFVIGEDGLARPVSDIELTEYLEGGEYDEVMGDELDEFYFDE